MYTSTRVIIHLMVENRNAAQIVLKQKEVKRHVREIKTVPKNVTLIKERWTKT